jgi:hypothetical protein
MLVQGNDVERVFGAENVATASAVMSSLEHGECLIADRVIADR